MTVPFGAVLKSGSATAMVIALASGKKGYAFTENRANCNVERSLPRIVAASVNHASCRACRFLNSEAVLAEISLRSPRKLCIFIIKIYIYRIKVSKK